MMTTEKLNKENKFRLKSDIFQSINRFAAVALVIGILVGALCIYLSQIDFSGFVFSRKETIFLIITITIITYIIFLLISIRRPLADLLKNEKRIQYEPLKDKRNNTNYGFHANIIADFKSQPVLVEYYLVFDQFELWVEKKDYDAFNIGDHLKLSIPVHTNRIIQIEKE